MPGPPEGRPIEGDWGGALGVADRVAEWSALFARELGAESWRAVLGRWAPRLAPGMVGAAAHGWIRTAHAVRALSGVDTVVRRRELARGLGYWAATYTPLPGRRVPGAVLPVEEAALRLPCVPATGPEALLTDGIPRLFDSAAFIGAVGRVDLRGEPRETVSALTRAAARLFLANCHRGPLFAAAHAVTATSALRIVLPHVSEATADTLLWHGWQTLAALQCAFGITTETPPLVPFEGGTDQLVQRAIDCGDEHAIKFTEACLREDSARHDPVYMAAARDLVGCFEALARVRRGAA